MFRQDVEFLCLHIWLKMPHHGVSCQEFPTIGTTVIGVATGFVKRREVAIAYLDVAGGQHQWQCCRR